MGFLLLMQLVILEVVVGFLVLDGFGSDDA